MDEKWGVYEIAYADFTARKIYVIELTRYCIQNLPDARIWQVRRALEKIPEIIRESESWLQFARTSNLPAVESDSIIRREEEDIRYLKDMKLQLEEYFRNFVKNFKNCDDDGQKPPDLAQLCKEIETFHAYILFCFSWEKPLYEMKKDYCGILKTLRQIELLKNSGCSNINIEEIEKDLLDRKDTIEEFIFQRV